MPTSQNRNEGKQPAGKAQMKALANQPRQSQRKPKQGEGERPNDTSISPIGNVATEEQYRARVSQKAYELYEKRLRATHVEDWLEAERLVKTELLSEGQWAGSV